jgi:hypothetical protein
MIFSFLYLFSFIAFVICLSLYPKTNNINFMSNIMFSYVTALCIGAIGAIVLQICQIPIDLPGMVCVYAIGAIVVLAATIRKHSVQKMEIRAFDFIVMAVGAMLIALFADKIFSRHLNINYLNMVDPANHYYYAMKVVRNKKISSMFFAPLYNGMFINMFQPFVKETWSYKLFILSDCFHTLMECFFFYGLMVYVCGKTKHRWIPVLVTALYWIGYPMYSFGGGAYIYWAMGAMLVEYVIFALKLYDDNESNGGRYIFFMLLGAISVTVCYIQFAPATFLSMFAVVIYKIDKKKKIVINKKLVVKLAIAGFITLICAMIGYYFVFYSNGLEILKQFKEGTNSSKSLELVVSVPIVYYLVYNQIKQKSLNAVSITLMGFWIVHTVFTLLACVNKVSSYYLFKDHFIFWALLWIILVDQRSNFKGKIGKYTIRYLVLVWSALMFLYQPSGNRETDHTYSLDNSIIRHDLLFLDYDYREPYLSTTKIEMMEYVYYNFDESDKVPLLGVNALKGVCAWYEGITNKESYWLSPLEQEDIENYLDKSGAQYFAVFKDCDAYVDNAEYLDSFEKVYENEEGFISKVY